MTRGNSFPIDMDLILKLEDTITKANGLTLHI